MPDHLGRLMHVGEPVKARGRSTTLATLLMEDRIQLERREHHWMPSDDTYPGRGETFHALLQGTTTEWALDEDAYFEALALMYGPAAQRHIVKEGA